MKFVNDISLMFAKSCAEKFDFICLDGDHSASTGYDEIPIVLKLLSQDGIILLHDYFPDGQPLWEGSVSLQGPYVAVARYRREGIPLILTKATSELS